MLAEGTPSEIVENGRAQGLPRRALPHVTPRPPRSRSPSKPRPRGPSRLSQQHLSGGADAAAATVDPPAAAVHARGAPGDGQMLEQNPSWSRRGRVRRFEAASLNAPARPSAPANRDANAEDSAAVARADVAAAGEQPGSAAPNATTGKRHRARRLRRHRRDALKSARPRRGRRISTAPSATPRRPRCRPSARAAARHAPVRR